MKTNLNADKIRELLGAHIAKVKEKNPRYSLRSLALKLGVSSGNLSQFLAGKRNFSVANIKKIVHLISDNPEVRKDILEKLNQTDLEDVKAKKSTSDYDSRTLSEDEFLKLTDWYHYAIRTLISLGKIKYDVEYISETLGIPKAYAQKAINLQMELGIVSVRDGYLERCHTHLKTPDSVKRNDRVDQMKRKIHGQHLDHARYSLENHGPDKRDFTWVNIPSNPAKLDQAREIIRKCQDDLLALLEDEDASELYRLTIQLCPIRK